MTSATMERIATAFAHGVGTLPVDDDGAGEELIEAARHAGQRFAAAQRWSRIIGDRIDTAALRDALGISRQAIAKRVVAGTLMAVAGSGTTWYPTWQFLQTPNNDRVRLEVRPVIPLVLQRFRDQLGDDSPMSSVISWAATEQPELDGMSPRAWIEAGGADAAVLTAAERAAAALAR